MFIWMFRQKMWIKTVECLKGCSDQNKTGEFCDKNWGNCKNSKFSFPDGKCEGDCIDSFYCDNCNKNCISDCKMW